MYGLHSFEMLPLFCIGAQKDELIGDILSTLKSNAALQNYFNKLKKVQSNKSMTRIQFELVYKIRACGFQSAHAHKHFAF